MVKEPTNLFPGPGTGERLEIIVIPGIKVSGTVVGIFDDAFVLENVEGDFEVVFKAAISWLKSFAELPPEDIPDINTEEN